jgi:hydrogenase maturation protein HypF
MIVHDLHPDYFTTRWAAESGTRTVAVQHHHAHVAAGMLEQGWLDREVLGVAWDGTGYGPDGTIWGGEFLLATDADFRRVARLRPFRLPGGEAAIREPWRVALVLLAEVVGPAEAMSFLTKRGWPASSLTTISQLSTRPTFSPRTSSIGRLFDAVATLALPYEATSGGTALYEGQLAMLLESACCWPMNGDEADDIGPYTLPVVGSEPAELDWRPLVAEVVANCRGGTPTSQIARRFHAALAGAVIAVARTYPELPIVLSGGVFQNRVLTELIARRFAAWPHCLGLPGDIPPGDGGLAAGQLVVALARLGSQ